LNSTNQEAPLLCQFSALLLPPSWAQTSSALPWTAIKFSYTHPQSTQSIDR